MSDIYYRKSFSRTVIPQWVKRMLRNKTLLWFTVITLVLLGTVTFGEKGVLERYHLQKQHDEINALIVKARQDSLALQKKLADLDTSKFAQEKVAREKYGMVREGETVYQVK